VTDLPADQAARDRALSIRESFHLEAPAGSGKTSVLLARFLALLAQVQEPEELLALTFTRKAAGELRTRVMELLRAPPAIGPDSSALDRLLVSLVEQVFRRHGDAAALKLAPERLPIMTFHSFCAQLLRLAPQEAGAPLDFQLLEQEAEWVKEEALEELRRRLAARPYDDSVRLALVRRLVRLNNDWPRLAREFRGLLTRRDSLEDFLKLARLSRQPEAYQDLLEKRFRMVLTPSLQTLGDEFAACPLGKLWPEFWRELDRGGAELASKLPPQVPGARPQDLPQWQALAEVLLTQKGEPRKQLSPKYGFPPDFSKTEWAALVREIPSTVAQMLQDCRELTLTGAHPEDVAALQDLVILLGEALAVYEELLSRRRALDFIALEQAALKLLDGENPGEVLLRLDYRIKHLLVDEFQDTSQGQMTLLCRLVSGWEAGDGRTLSVVGDPKQSIYGWRQAKVRLFLESREGLPCPESRFPLDPLLLNANFRSTRTLIDWANQVFGQTVMAGASSHERVEFHAATPGPKAAAGEAPYLALFLGSGADTPREAEARWLAGQLAQAAAQAEPEEKIGVLLFARTHLATYLQALQDAGLSVRVREGLKLTDSLVVRHLHNLGRALVRPQDDLTWAAVLRGPWAPQPLEVLARTAGMPGEGWPEKFGKFAASEACPPELRRFLEPLLLAREQVGRRPLAEVVQNLLEASLAWQGLAAWEGPGGVANARAYLDLLVEAESGLAEETLSRADFYLRDAYQPPDPRSQDSQVEILTVHLAKGLEFDRVFIPYLDWQPLQADDKIPPFLLEEIPGTGLHGLALARAYLQEKQSSFYRLLNRLRRRRILDEARRVFYVAATRARRRLTLSGVIKQDGEGITRVPPDSPLGWLWRHYGRPEAAPGTFLWADPEIRGEAFTLVSAATAGVQPEVELPPAWDFTPEAAPYRMEFPSRMAQEVWEGEPGRAEGAAETDTPWIRGRVIHRLLDTLARGGDLPSAEAVAAALRQEGLAPEAAPRLAPEILAEVAACRRDPFLSRLLAPRLPEGASEWLLESQPQLGVIRRGVMDRLAFDGRDWWLLDYKTSRPEREEDWDAFITQEKEKYAPQIRAYQEMAARAKNIHPEEIHLGLYFTAIQKMVELI